MYQVDSFSSDPHKNKPYTASKNWTSLNNELEEIWKEPVVIYFKELIHGFPGGTEGKNEKTVLGYLTASLNKM
jgi:hypothetical protein